MSLVVDCFWSRSLWHNIWFGLLILHHLLLYFPHPYQHRLSRRNQLAAIMNPPDTTIMFDQGISSTRTRRPPPVRVITFDLDNTLWNTGATISAANDALAAFLSQNQIQQSKRTEVIMGELFAASPATYCPLDGEAGKSPVLLTQLRTDALTRILMGDNDYSPHDAEVFAKQAFEKVGTVDATFCVSCMR